MIKKLWRKYVTRPTKFEGSKLPLKYAFTANGIDYYEPENIEQLPWMRALTLHQYYEELRMKVDREYLEQHAQAVDILINGTKDKPKKRFTFEDLAKLNRVNNMLKERLQFIFTPDLVYKVASVIFIDESENPAKYDEVHNRKKIEQWKANGLDAFFFERAGTTADTLFKLLAAKHKELWGAGERDTTEDVDGTGEYLFEWATRRNTRIEQLAINYLCNGVPALLPSIESWSIDEFSTRLSIKLSASRETPNTENDKRWQK